MKQNTYILVLTLFFGYTASAANSLFIENQYGAQIIVKANNKNKSAKYTIINDQETPINNTVRLRLGLVPWNEKELANWVNSLEIKTSRYVPLSSFYSLDDYISDHIAGPLIACCKMKMNAPICKEDICKKDAVLIVKPSNILSEWDISHRWEFPYR